MLYKYYLMCLFVALPTLSVSCRAFAAPFESLNFAGPESAPGSVSAPANSTHATEESFSFTSKEKRNPTGKLTLEEAAGLALLQNPGLAAFSQAIRAREAAVLQASLLPNPRLSVQGSGLANPTLEGVDGNAITIKLSQLILLGGKIAKRVRVAHLSRDLAIWDYVAKRADVLTRVAQSFIAVLSAQKRVALAQQLVRLAERTVAAVSKQVQAGQVPPVQQSKAKVLLSSMRIRLIQAKQALQTARRQLAATWGSTTPRFQKAVGRLGAVSSLPPLKALTQRIGNNPDLARWTTVIAQRQAILDLEQSRAIPNLTLSVGGTHYANTGDYAIVAGISIPLPLFDRNQGAILQAQHRLAQAKKKRRAAAIRIATALSAAYQRATAAYDKARILQTQVLPAARRAFEATKTGFRLGKFNFLSVLDAHRTLFDAKSQYLRALTRYHQAVAEIERLIGGQLGAARALGQTTGSGSNLTTHLHLKLDSEL